MSSHSRVAVRIGCADRAIESPITLTEAGITGGSPGASVTGGQAGFGKTDHSASTVSAAAVLAWGTGGSTSVRIDEGVGAASIASADTVIAAPSAPQAESTDSVNATGASGRVRRITGSFWRVPHHNVHHGPSVVSFSRLVQSSRCRRMRFNGGSKVRSARQTGSQS